MVRDIEHLLQVVEEAVAFQSGVEKAKGWSNSRLQLLELELKRQGQALFGGDKVYRKGQKLHTVAGEVQTGHEEELLQ